MVGLGDRVSNQSNLAFDVVVASHHDKIILWPWLDITQLSSERLGFGPLGCDHILYCYWANKIEFSYDILLLTQGHNSTKYYTEKSLV